MSSTSELNLPTLRREMDRWAQELRTAKLTVGSEESELARASAELEAAAEAQTFIQTVAQAIQQQAHQQIASVVSRCLATVFEEPYVFKIHFDRKRGRTEARLVFEKHEKEVDPLTASGGGVIHVAAFSLRLACLLLSRPRRRRLLIADEPFGFVSAEYRERVAVMIQELSKELKVQIVMVTHSPEFIQGKVIKL
jgi:DNA repair exonuclease SbcCD ATPase subunit